MAPDRPTAVALAAHRFGLGEPSLDAVGGDARGWLEAQIGPLEPARGEGLLDTASAIRLVAAEQARIREARALRLVAAAAESPTAAAGRDAAQDALVAALASHYRETIAADQRSRLVTAASTARPFAERMQLFWANHFTVSLARGATRGLIGAFERDAIRPHVFGRFEDLLVAAVTHPAMLRYLDNAGSAGPRSRVVLARARADAALARPPSTPRAGESPIEASSMAPSAPPPPRLGGLNENLAREVLELHTLGAAAGRGSPVEGGGYGQADVTAFAALLTGWRVVFREERSGFDPAWHEPGPKTVLGRTYPEGAEALPMVLRDLARHPATARHVATRLARHVVADEPPGPLVDALAATFRRTDGDLAAVARALVRHDAAWTPVAGKLKTPEEFVVASARLLRLGPAAFDRNPAAAVGSLGQRVHAAPSPAGWSDRAEDWLGPDAVWKRVEWATRLAERAGKQVDARRLADVALGPLLTAGTARQIERAADGPQALALLLLAPELQRR